MPPRYTKRVLQRLDELEQLNQKVADAKPQMLWYAVQTQPGKEREVVRAIKRQAHIQFVGDYIGRIIVARQKTVELRKSQRVTMRRKRLPMYLVCHLRLNNQVRRIVNSAPGSLGFLPERHDPRPLEDHEVELLLLQEKENSKSSVYKVETGLQPGDHVEITKGAFAGQTVKVKKVANEGTKDPVVQCHATMWGRPCPIELRTGDYVKVNYEGGE